MVGTLFEAKVDAEHCTGSRAGNQVAGMRQVDVEAIQNVVHVGLELQLFADRALQHRVEGPVAGFLLMATLVTT